MLTAMPDYGLKVSTQFAADIAVFLHGGVPWVPCLWLDTSREGKEIQECWHITEDPGERLAVPKYFRTADSLACYGHLSETLLMAKVTRFGEENGVSLFRDATSGHIFAGPGPLRRH